MDDDWCWLGPTLVRPSPSPRCGVFNGTKYCAVTVEEGSLLLFLWSAEVL
jgi:hypothetical protein